MISIIQRLAARLLDYVIEGGARRVADAIFDWIDGRLSATASAA